MTLRIFEGTQGGEVFIALHGWLNAGEVEEVAKAVARQGPSARIDLAHLAGVDVAGLRALRRLRETGARLTGATPYMELLLKRPAVDGER
jgi:hypothetical protein